MWMHDVSPLALLDFSNVKFILMLKNVVEILPILKCNWGGCHIEVWDSSYVVWESSETAPWMKLLVVVFLKKPIPTH